MSAADSAQPFNALFLSSDSPLKPPFYEGKHVLLDGRLEQWTGDVSTVYSPLLRQCRLHNLSQGPRTATRCQSSLIVRPTVLCCAALISGRAHRHRLGTQHG